MKTYEAFIILKPILDVDNSDNVLKSVEDTVESLGGKVIKKDKMGRKRLAYEIKKFKDGFITTYLLSMDPARLDEFRRACQLNEDILRLMLINRSEVEMDSLTVAREQRPERPPMGERHHHGGERGPRPAARAAE